MATTLPGLRERLQRAALPLEKSARPQGEKLALREQAALTGRAALTIRKESTMTLDLQTTYERFLESRL